MESESLEDLIGGLVPHERPWILVPARNPGADRIDQLLGRAVAVGAASAAAAAGTDRLAALFERQRADVPRGASALFHFRGDFLVR
jgi:hypothetical protein